MLKIRFIIFFYDKLFIPLKHQAGFTKANQVQGLKKKKKKLCFSNFFLAIVVFVVVSLLNMPCCLIVDSDPQHYKFLSFPKNFLGSLTHQIHQKTNMGRSLGEF